ncbi:MAG: FAD-binding protein, partial [Ilumatobacteraceae bacterium]
MSNTRSRVVSNWAGNQRCLPDAVHQPRSTDEVARIVQFAHESGQRVKVIGAGHSFTATAMTDGVMLRLDNMQQIIHVDSESRRVHVQAGAKLHDLCRELHEYGLALPNLGDIDVQSVAGAISTATHGTGIALGNLATNVVAMTIVDGTGRIVQLDEGDPRISIAAVGVGALGIVCEVVLQCVPSFRLHAHETIESIDDVLSDVPGFAESADHA